MDSFKDILLLIGVMFFQTIFLYYMTRNNSQEAQNQINTKTSKSSKKVYLIYPRLWSILGTTFVNRDGVARSSNARYGTSRTPQTYTGNISELWEELDELFKEKKRVEKRSMARLYPKVAEEIREIVIKHKKGDFHWCTSFPSHAVVLGPSFLYLY